MIQIRKSDERGHANHGWLDSYHSFSFGHYYDPEHMNWRYLRVLNEDRIAAGAGFPTHPHDNMEIFSYVTEGALEHKDSLGNTARVHPGRAQLMRAGTGITHSEYNPSEEDPTHLFQVWILPAKRNQPPRYQELDFSPDELDGRLKLLAAPGSNSDAMDIDQDVRIYAGRLGAGEKVSLPRGEYGWLQVLSGQVRLNEHPLDAGDAAGVENESDLTLEGVKSAEVLWFSMDHQPR